MRIAIAQLNYHIGNFDATFEKMCKTIAAAKADRADLVVFSELAVSGYPARDFLEQTDFIARCEAFIDRLSPLCEGIACIVGCPTVNVNPSGKRLFNAAFLLQEGRIQDVIHKALLPTYDIFDEYRYFEPSTAFHCIHVNGLTIALTICEDLWNIVDPIYPVSPMDALIRESPDLMINIAASPFAYNHVVERKKVLQLNCEKYGLPLVYVNHVGAQTELIFDGGSLAYDRDGTCTHELKYFEEDYQVIDVLVETKASSPAASRPKDKVPFLRSDEAISRIKKALVLGIQDYFFKSGFKKAVFGLSGGIDSALVAALAAEALGPENILAVLLPSRYSSNHSISDAMALAGHLKIEHLTLPIIDIVDGFTSTLYRPFMGMESGVAEENIQSRVRGTVLMALSNKLGYILLNTSNKSENAVGYGTLYGDMCGALGIIGDVYKTQVYALCNYMNREKSVIPQPIIAKAPSAELRPDQKDSDSLPDYAVLDEILFQHIEERKPLQEIVSSAGHEVVAKVIGLVNTAEFKRYQAAPILRVSSKAFGMGRRMPIVGKY